MSILTKEIFKGLTVFHDFESNSKSPIYVYLREWLNSNWNVIVKGKRTQVQRIISPCGSEVMVTTTLLPDSVKFNLSLIFHASENKPIVKEFVFTSDSNVIEELNDYWVKINNLNNGMVELIQLVNYLCASHPTYNDDENKLHLDIAREARDSVLSITPLVVVLRKYDSGDLDVDTIIRYHHTFEEPRLTRVKFECGSHYEESFTFNLEETYEFLAKCALCNNKVIRFPHTTGALELVRTLTGMLAEYTFTNLVLSTKQKTNESSRIANALNDCNIAAGFEWLSNKHVLLSEMEGDYGKDERIAYYMNEFPKTSDLVNEAKPKGISGSFIKDEFNTVVSNLDKLVSPFNELTTTSLQDVLRDLTRRFTPTHLHPLHDIVIDVIAADRERYFIVNVSGVPPYTDLEVKLSEHSYIEDLVKILTYIFNTTLMVLKNEADIKLDVSSTMPKPTFKWQIT